MRNHFINPRRELNWAKNDFAQLQKTANRFFNSCPHLTTVELDDKGAEEVHKVKLSRPLPEALAQRTFSTLEALRAALDMVAYSVAAVAGCPSRSVYFPFCATAADFDSRFKSCCKQFPQEMYTLFGGFKPYQGGDDILWALNELSRKSKHSIIAPVGLASEPVNLDMIADSPTRVPLGTWDTEKEELIYLITQPGANIQCKFQISFSIGFREVEVVKGKPVQVVLKY